MKLAYIMTCHKNPEQINRLIHTLSDGNCDFYLHIDKKNYQIVKHIVALNTTIIPYEESIEVQWGQISQVEATLVLINSIIKSKKSYDYVIFISGQDFPIKTNQQIQAFFEKNKGKQFITTNDPKMAKKRYEIYYPKWMVSRKLLPRLIQVSYKIITGGRFHTFRFFKRKSPFREFYVGSNWWALSFDCVLEIMKLINENPTFLKYYEHTANPDESFFQTILMNYSSYKDKCMPFLTYVDFPAGANSPKILTMQDKEILLKSDKLFARKFDMYINKDIIDLMDNLRTEEAFY